MMMIIITIIYFFSCTRFSLALPVYATSVNQRHIRPHEQSSPF